MNRNDTKSGQNTTYHFPLCEIGEDAASVLRICNCYAMVSHGDICAQNRPYLELDVLLVNLGGSSPSLFP